MAHLVVTAASLALLLSLAGPAAAQPMTCPEGTRLGSNDFAFLGGFRLWRNPSLRT